MSYTNGVKHIGYKTIFITLSATLFLYILVGAILAKPAHSQVGIDIILNSTTRPVEDTTGFPDTTDTSDTPDTTDTTDTPSTASTLGTPDTTLVSDAESDTAIFRRADRCFAVTKGQYTCNNRLIYFFKNGTNDLQAALVDEATATNIFNKLASVQDTCVPIANNSATNTTINYYCSGAPEYHPRVNIQNRSVILFVPSVEDVPVDPGDVNIEDAARPQDSKDPIETSNDDPEIKDLLPAGSDDTSEPIVKDQPAGDIEPIQIDDIPTPLPMIIEEILVQNTGADLSKSCIDAGIATERQCAVFLAQESLATECKDNNVYTVEGCKRFTLAQHVTSGQSSGSVSTITQELPSKCEQLGVTDSVQCNLVVAESAVAQDCRAADVITRVACNQYLEEKYKDNTLTVCDDAESPEECTERSKKEFINRTSCVGLARISCERVLRTQHYGTWLASKDRIEKNDGVVAKLLGKPVLTTTRLESDERELIEQTITNDRPIFVYPSNGGVIITEANELTNAPSAVLILDDDGDGLSNELEERLGTDPERRDTDDDGFDDREELKNGFNPLGDGEKTFGFWPVDGAMIHGLPLDQPITSEAEIDESFSVAQVINKTSDSTKPLHTISGKGPANTLLTLFVYSTLPMVLTVQSDSAGNWEYELRESLADGDHEVFVTLVDSLGTITKKSRSLTFFIQEAQAVDVDEFFGFSDVTVSADVEPVQQLSRYYFIGAVVLVMLAILVSIFFIWNRRSSPSDIPDVTDDDVSNV